MYEVVNWPALIACASFSFLTTLIIGSALIARYRRIGGLVGKAAEFVIETGCWGIRRATGISIVAFAIGCILVVVGLRATR